MDEKKQQTKRERKHLFVPYFFPSVKDFFYTTESKKGFASSNQSIEMFNLI